MKNNTKKGPSTTGPILRANESKNVSSQNAASAETCTPKAVDPIMHTMCFEDDLPIHYEIKYYLAHNFLNDDKGQLYLYQLLIEQYAWDIVKTLLQRSPMRQDYLDYRIERFFITHARQYMLKHPNDCNISYIIYGYLQSKFS